MIHFISLLLGELCGTPESSKSQGSHVSSLGDFDHLMFMFKLNVVYNFGRILGILQVLVVALSV